MKKEQLSLMTFTLDVDVAMKKMTVKDCLLLAKNEGIPYIDVRNPSQNRLKEYMAALEETGVKLLCYIGSVSFFSNDEQKIREALTEQLHAAAAMGAKLFMIVPVNPQKDEKACAKLGKAEARKRLKKYFSLAVSLAEGSGIQVCFETTPQDYSCLSGTEDCRWVLEQVSGLGLVYDTANMLPHGDDPLEYYEALKDHIVHVHVKDVALTKATLWDRMIYAERAKSGEVMKCCLFGQGVIPLKEILQRLDRDGYRGGYALEYSHPKKYPATAEQNAARLKEHIVFLNFSLKS